MKKLVWINLILILCSNYAMSQISGFVYDEGLREPVIGASIFTPCIMAPPRFNHAKTDIDGYFVFRRSCKKMKIIISYPGYAVEEIEYESSDKINLDTIFLKRAPKFSNYPTAQISGFIGDESKEPLIGASIITYCKTDSSGFAGTITDPDGHFKLRSSCKKGKIMISYIGYENTEVEYSLKNGKIDLGTITLKPHSQQIVWDGESVKFNRNLKGRWELIYFKTFKNKKYDIDEEDKGYFYFEFFKEDYKLKKYGSFFYCSGSKKDQKTIFMLTKNNVIEFRTEMYVEILPLRRDLYVEKIRTSGLREKKRLAFLYEFYTFLKLFRYQNFRYKLENNELLITNGIEEILLKKSK